MTKPTPAINLGTLQETLRAARTGHKAATRALARAEAEADSAKAALATAAGALAQASRTVLTQE